MNASELASIAQSLVPPGRGILAADESTPTIKKRFDSINLESTAENRRAYRDMLFTTPGMEEFISGIILFDETLRQSSADGTPFPALLSGKGVVPGIKVDKGAKDLAAFPGEKMTHGLDGLRERLAEYRDLGARFAKWRAVITIGAGIPTRACIQSNARALAHYAALTQEAGLVPIVEPEVLMDGDHDMNQCAEVTAATLTHTFFELQEMRVLLEGILLKPNMVITGKDNAKVDSPEEVAEATVRTFQRTVPPAVPGIVFLSGGQSAQQATANLNAMNAMGAHPWELSYSYGRALQAEALQAWGGEAANVGRAQQAFQRRGKCTSAARYGKYTPEMEADGA